MQRVGGISAELRPPWWPIAAFALVGALGLAGWGAWQDGWTAPSWRGVGLPVALLLVAGVAALAGAQARHAAQQQAWADALRGARARQQCIDEVLDLWQFQTDASHHVTELRPPNRAAPAGWRSAAATGVLWELFCTDDDAALQAQMRVGAALDDVAVRRQDEAGSHPGLLQARPRHDALGEFVGYHGVVREGEATAPQAAQAAPAVAAPADGLGAEQESFGYTVSHDLRAPIRVVEGFTKIIKEDYGRLLDRVGNDHLDRVLGAAARMNNMIDALLALSRLASQPLARQPVNLSQLAGYIADDLRRQSPERQVQLMIEPGIQLQGDPTLLRVVLENLLGNAWKYTAKCAQPQVVFERQPGVVDTYTVRDNGAGFDMRFADRLFGVFQRLHSANDFPGTGIGLASVRRIVRRHGGDIWGEAEVNRGARFHFSLPQTSLPQTFSPQTSSPQASSAPTPPPWPAAQPAQGVALSSSPMSQRAVPRAPGLASTAAPVPRAALPAAGQPAREPPSSASSNLNA